MLAECTFRQKQRVIVSFEFLVVQIEDGELQEHFAK